MRIELAFLRSRLGRRAFWFFLAVLLVPITVAVTMAVANVERRLTEQAHTQLHQAAKSYGLSVLERLLIVQDELRAMAAAARVDTVLPGVRERHVQLFEGVAQLDEEGRVRPLKGFPSIDPGLVALAAESLRPPVTLAGIASSQHRAHVFISVPFAGAGGGSLVGHINPGFLWHEAELLPSESIVCALDREGVPLFCPNQEPSHLLRLVAGRSRTQATGELDWPDGGQTQLGTYWSLFAEPSFGTSWVLLASQPEQDAVAPVAAFKRLFLPAMVALALLALLLTVVQIRRRLAPLDQLMAATRRVAARRFDQPVTVQSDDEFEDLADAFNVMSARLGSQFQTMETLAEVDRQILVELDIEAMVRLILERLPEIVPCQQAAIAVVDRDTDQRARLLHTATENEQGAAQRLVWHGPRIESLLAHRSVVDLHKPEADSDLLDSLRSLEIRFAAMVPIVLEQRLCGVIALGYEDKPALQQEDWKSLRDLAHRIAVAIAAAEREQQLYRQAYYDGLTNLPNRQLFNDRLEQALVRARRDNLAVALLFIDLDHFKKVNDSAGHPAGDQLLQQTAQRLRGCVREADTVARLGGDEFTLLMSGPARPEQAAQLAAAINEAFREPFPVDGGDYYVSASIGIALYPGDGMNARDLLKHADTAMYVAKDQGRNRYSFFEPHMNTDVTNRTTLEAELRRALAHEEFLLHYQPQVNAQTGRVSGAEALLRWQHPKRGLLGPQDFIAVAEESGLIAGIGRLVLFQASRQYASWRAEGLELDHLSVNVAPHEFQQEDFVEIIYEILKDTELPPLQLGLEITERLLMSDLQDTIDKLHQLKSLGVTLAIDDFGIGYSSLSYLRRFPIDTLKIDRSFLLDVTSNEDSAAIVRAITGMARALQLQVVAEGVEQREQIDFLKAEGCHEIQGYYYSRPLPPERFTEFVRQYSETNRLAAL